MKLYHGTNVEFSFIKLDKCPYNRDFGQGFYVTRFLKHAQERAQDKVDDEGGNPFILEYEFDIDAAQTQYPDLKIKRFDEINEEWAMFVMFNRLRKKEDQSHEYDIVEGAVANDKMFRQFRYFSNNRIRLKEFINSLRFPLEPTHQIAFCTDKALDVLLEQNEPPRYKIEGLIAKLSVAVMRDFGKDTIEAMKTVYDSEVFTLIEKTETKFYLKSWQDIYEMLRKEL